jgi:hypothetical protein
VSDFGRLTPQRVSPASDLQLSALLDLGDYRVAGYTIDLFYP